MRPEDTQSVKIIAVNLRIFFHPDFTVGIGITPILRNALADFTAGREFHPALKMLFS